MFTLIKIVLTKNPETTKQKYKDYFIKRSDTITFNIEYNVFFAKDSFQLKNEMNMQAEFMYYFKFLLFYHILLKKQRI